jgi:DNA polymerase-3 subunit epsilon/ATP-dependent DNA helicase DinG
VRAPLADLDELSAAAYEAAPALRAIVAQVCARNEACAGRRCPDQAFCPVEVARARAQNADVIVVNHALLLAGAGTTVLPEHAHVVIDEAHNLEDVATDQLGHEVSDASVRGLLRLLQGEDAEPIHTRVAECLRGGGTPTADVVAEAETEFPQGVARIEYALEDLAAAVLDFIEHAPTVERSDRNAIRLRPEVRTSRAWEPVVEALPPVDEALGAGAQSLARFARAVEDATKEPDDETAALLVDLQHLHNLLAQMAHSVGIVVAGTADRDFVCWVGSWTTRRGDLGWSLRAAPIDVGPPLQEAVYKGARTLVMTSATLTVDDRFDYLRQRLGLDAERERLAELTVPSPFDFPHQLLMCIPADLPLPGERGFDEAAQEAIFQAACAAGGGTLCLFTSRDSMARAHDRLAERLQAADLTPICQDLATSRTAALEALREEPTAVLFGVKSFWEGVDVPGEALRCLVIVKLPFAVPSDPIIEARQERVEELGSNGYDEFYVPNAVIGFRQGVGRLIRNQTDRGAVFVLDRRILLRRYGARFIESLPACRMARGKLADCVAEARSMFRSVEGEPS